MAVQLIEESGAVFNMASSEPACSCTSSGSDTGADAALDFDALLTVDELTAGLPEGMAQLDGLVSVYSTGLI